MGEKIKHVEPASASRILNFSGGAKEEDHSTEEELGGEEVTNIAKKIANRASGTKERRACGLESEYKQVARRDPPSEASVLSRKSGRITPRGVRQRETHADTRAHTRVTGIVIQRYTSLLNFFALTAFVFHYSFFSAISSSSLTGALSSRRETLEVADDRGKE